ncbi:putative metalloprotease CJM1_0395 family protein [Vreelandella rituensis]|uniref:SprA-related family protein n=1 Tax=Vreelandella rituensis TaxID=2282306 RepID=A0A368TXQ2_9GAMM|nr:putative metalloprotease CJM1_0395 family protein [Halomonas rituensis]RCV89599.1 hypothetical protein DU506_12570 [Halomonas rituensis]
MPVTVFSPEPTPASARVDAASPSRGAPGTGTPIQEEKSETNAAKKDTQATKEETKATGGPTRPDGTPLDDQELRHLGQLKQTDRSVRQHEQAHEVVGAQYAGSASYEYEQGPDGQRYAVAGEVPIDYGPVSGDPDATIEKMQTVIAAALAPADPSTKDLQVAAQARQYLLAAQLESAMLRSEMDQARSGVDTSSDAEPSEAVPDESDVSAPAASAA